MAKYLVTFNDICNEVEITGFSLMTEKEVEAFEQLAESITWEFTYPLITNAEIEFLSGEDLLSRIEFKEISNEEYKALNKVFNEPFGVFITEEFLQELLDEEEDFDSDEEEEEDDDWGSYRSDTRYNEEDDDDIY
jgi:hypothetical protein